MYLTMAIISEENVYYDDKIAIKRIYKEKQNVWQWKKKSKYFTIICNTASHVIYN